MVKDIKSDQVQFYSQRIKQLFEHAQRLNKIEKISHIPELIPSVCLQLSTRAYFPQYELELPSYLTRPNYYEILPDGQMVLVENADPFRKADEQPEEFCIAKTALIPFYKPIYTALREAGNCRVFGIDKNEQLYAWEQNKGVYIFDAYFTYCNFEAVNGDFIAWYLNAHGDMCMVFTCPEDHGESMDVYRISCDRQLPKNRLQPIRPPWKFKQYASVHIRCDEFEKYLPKILTILQQQEGHTYKILCEERGHYLSIYETYADKEHIKTLSEKLAKCFPRTVIATFGTTEENETMSIFGKRSQIADIFYDGTQLTTTMKWSELLSNSCIDPWTRKRMKQVPKWTIDLYCKALMVYAKFPSKEDLSPNYIFANAVTVEGNVQVFHALKTDFDERREEAEAQEKSRREAFLNSANSSAQLVELSHIKGELEEPIIVGWWYLLPNQKLTLYDPKGYLNERELGFYGIQPDGSVSQWEESMAEKPILIPNFSALDQIAHACEDWILLDIMSIGIDRKDRIYASGKHGIYVMDRDMTRCSFVKCSKMIDGWYLNDAGEFCFFGRNQNIDGGQPPDTWVYKIVIDETQWEDCHEVGCAL